MNELSLFTGAGGGLLGTHLLGWRPIGYVEWNDYCQRIIAARIADGVLPNAPIFGNIKTFIDSGCAELYRGVADIITAGFPCQPFSVAGKQQAADDDRNMWPETIETIRVVRPSLVFLENVPGLLACGYATTVVNDLQRANYQVLPPLIIGANDVGAPHKRDRVWTVAYTDSGCRQRTENEICSGRHVAERCGQNVADSSIEGSGRLSVQPGRPQQEGAYADRGGTGINGRQWWAVEPDVGRMAHGVAHRVDRLTAIGNGQVPMVVRAAWELLNYEAQI